MFLLFNVEKTKLFGGRFFHINDPLILKEYLIEIILSILEKDNKRIEILKDSLKEKVFFVEVGKEIRKVEIKIENGDLIVKENGKILKKEREIMDLLRKIRNPKSYLSEKEKIEDVGKFLEESVLSCIKDIDQGME